MPWTFCCLSSIVAVSQSECRRVHILRLFLNIFGQLSHHRDVVGSSCTTLELDNTLHILVRPECFAFDWLIATHASHPYIQLPKRPALCNRVFHILRQAERHHLIVVAHICPKNYLSCLATYSGLWWCCSSHVKPMGLCGSESGIAGTTMLTCATSWSEMA